MPSRDDPAGGDAADDEPFGPPRDVPPPRPVPRARRTPRAGPDLVGEKPCDDEPSQDEPEWKRELREESEFRAQFGAWQEPGPAPRIGPTLVGALLVIAVLVVLVRLVVG